MERTNTGIGGMESMTKYKVVKASWGGTEIDMYTELSYQEALEICEGYGWEIDEGYIWDLVIEEM